MRIGLLNNLRAGRNNAQVSRLLGFLRRHPEVLHVETNSADVVPEALGELAGQEVDLLVVNGGDGTLQHALTEILANRAFDGRVPMIAPLRGGRTNMSSLDLGARRDPVRGFAELLDAVERGRIEERISPRRVIRVRHGINLESQYGMFFGLGLIQRAIDFDHSHFDKGAKHNVQGVVSATMVTGGMLGRLAMGDQSGILAPDKVQMIIDGEPLEHDDHRLVIACTLRKLFSGMRPFWGEGPGGLPFTSIANGAHRLPWALPGILAGRPARFVREENGYTSRNAMCVKLRMDCGFTVDGENHDPEPGRIVELTADRTVQFVRA